MKTSRYNSLNRRNERLAWTIAGLVASAFIGFIVLEIASTGTGEQSDVLATTQPQATAPAIPGPQKAVPDAELSRVTLARPLFSPSRRPASDGTPSDVNASNTKTR